MPGEENDRVLLICSKSAQNFHHFFHFGSVQRDRRVEEEAGGREKSAVCATDNRSRSSAYNLDEVVVFQTRSKVKKRARFWFGCAKTSPKCPIVQ